MAELNLTQTGDLARVQSVDFTNRFGENITKLMEALGVTRQLPLAEGMLVKTYTATTDLQDGDVAEGEIIPLSKVTTVPGETYEMAIKKWRKAVSGEAIQRHGFDQAVTQTDEAMIRLIQRNIRQDFFTFLKSGTQKRRAEGLQASLAKAWGDIETVFEDDAADTIAFVNPKDIAKYIGNAPLTTQNVFGMTFVEGFTNVKVVSNTMVPEGKLYATAPENLVLAYIPVPGSAMASTFNLTSDATGYIGLTHGTKQDNFTIETLAVSGVMLFAERLDGIVEVTITEPAVDPGA